MWQISWSTQWIQGAQAAKQTQIITCPVPACLAVDMRYLFLPNMVLSSMAKHLLFGLVCPKTSCGFFRCNLANFSHTVLFFWRRRGFFPETPSNKPYLLKLILIVNMLAETCRIRAVALGFFALSENCRESVGMLTPGKIVVFCLQTPECFEIFYFCFSQDTKILLFPKSMFSTGKNKVLKICGNDFSNFNYLSPCRTARLPWALLRGWVTSLSSMCSSW